MKILKWGIIGCGGIADRRTIPGIQKTDNSVVYAVMDLCSETADRVKAKYGCEKAYYTVSDICADKDVDVIYIATPVCFHKEQALKAIACGKHVFIEKPMAFTSSDAEEILNAAKAKNLNLMIGYIMRYHNLHVKMRGIIERGGLGQIVSMRSMFCCWYPDIEGAWRQKRSMSAGGSVMDLGVHCLDIMQFVTGEKIIDTKSYLNTKTFNYEVEDSGAVVFKSESGAFGHIDVNFNIPDNAGISRLEIYGTKGSLIAEGTLGQTESGTLKYTYCPQDDYAALQERKEAAPEIFCGGNGDIYAKQAHDFSAGVLSEKPDYSFAQSSVDIQRLCEQIYKESQS